MIKDESQSKYGMKFRKFLEISHATAQNLHKWYKNISQLAFSDIFGDKVRLVIPYNPNDWDKIKNKIENLKNKKTGEPQNYKVDLLHGIVTQSGVTLQGKPFERTIKLGKVIQQELGKEEQDYYNKVGNPTAKSLEHATDFSIVISRHPIDIARMSDHAGISSCHEEGDRYFACALSEAKGHGPVAYLVSTASLARVKDLQADEIFRDPERGIDGITPISRIRIRRFKSEGAYQTDYDLAIPEKRIYGQHTTGAIADSFRNSLLDWARTSQEKIFGERPPMKDFVRTGGSYADNNGAELFNRFFGDKKDYGDTEYEGEDDFGNMVEQWKEEIEDIRSQYTFSNRVYGDAQVETDDGQPIVYISGNVEFTLNTKEFINLDFMDRKKFPYEKVHQLNRVIENELKPLDLSRIEEIDFEIGKNSNEINVRFRLDTDRLERGPDGFRAMMDSLKKWDKKYTEAGSLLRLALSEFGLMKPTDLEQATETWDEKLKNFEWDNNSGYGHGIVDVTSKPIILDTISTPNIEKWQKLKSGKKLIDDFKKAFEMSIINKIKNIRLDDRKQLMLPGFSKNNFQPNPRWALGKMEINVREDGGRIKLRLAFEMDHNQAKLKNTIEYIHYLDKEFPSIESNACILFHQMVMDCRNDVRDFRNQSRHACSSAGGIFRVNDESGDNSSEQAHHQISYWFHH